MSCQLHLSLSPKVLAVPSFVLPSIMSEKLKEFVDIPQQFVREGNQVRTRPDALENTT